MFADEFEKEMEKQTETDVLTCDDLSHDMLSVSPDHSFLATTPTSFVGGETEPLDVDCFVDQFMQRNLGQNCFLTFKDHLYVFIVRSLCSNRATRTAGHLRIFCIVTHKSSLKTNDVAAEDKRTCQPFLLIELASIIHVHTK